MKFFPHALPVLITIAMATSLLAVQRNAVPQVRNPQVRNPYDVGPGYISSNGLEHTGFIFARLRYSSSRSYADYGYGFRFGGGWSEDFPRADRQLMQGTNRLTRILARSTE